MYDLVYVFLQIDNDCTNFLHLEYERERKSMFIL